MNRFINLFHKKHLIILIGIIFLSVSSIESHYHEEHDINHSEAECHFCINDLFDDNIDIPPEKLFLSDLNNFINLDNYTPQFFINFHSRAPPKI
tara:strand:+ start:469 stop:750 length:282 start_codon:yes stop_codon:yes gene_type:complete